MNKFRDRTEAGWLLAGKLAIYANRPDVVVLALPRGGVPVAFAIASALRLPLGVIPVRKLAVPGWSTRPIGGIAAGGVVVLDHQIMREHDVSPRVVDLLMAAQSQELNRQEAMFRSGHRAPAIKGQTVILVDDGMVTGTSMRTAIAALREQQPAGIVVAVPVAEISAYHDLRQQSDWIVCLATPERLGNFGSWYDDFAPTTDDQIIDMLRQSRSHVAANEIGMSAS